LIIKENILYQLIGMRISAALKGKVQSFIDTFLKVIKFIPEKRNQVR
jgi:hypothetical protein